MAGEIKTLQVAEGESVTPGTASFGSTNLLLIGSIGCGDAATSPSFSGALSGIDIRAAAPAVRLEDTSASKSIEMYMNGTELTFGGINSGMTAAFLNFNGLGLGVATPSRPLELNSSFAGACAEFENSNATASGALIDLSAASNDNNTQYFLRCDDSTTTRAYIYSDGDMLNHDGTFSTISDERLKQDETPAKSQWDDFKKFQFKNYRLKSDVAAGKDNKLLSLMAGQVEAISPGLVKEADVWLGKTRKVTKSVPVKKVINGLITVVREDIEVEEKVDEKVKILKQSILYMKGMVVTQECQSRIESIEARLKALEAAS